MPFHKIVDELGWIDLGIRTLGIIGGLEELTYMRGLISDLVISNGGCCFHKPLLFIYLPLTQLINQLFSLLIQVW